jgi:creatinine amidohydrolase
MDIQYDKLAWPDIKEAVEQDYIVIIPLGCTEQQGPHLPLDNDSFLVTFCATEGVRKARERFGIKALVLPTLPYGPAEEHMKFPGTISISFEAWFAFVKDILESLIRHGFRRILLAGVCGGHFGIHATAYEVWVRAKRSGKDIILEVCPDEAFKLLETFKEFCPDVTEVHAGDFTTSIHLAVRPELVRKERIRMPKYRVPEDSSWWIMEDISDTGDTGDSSKASKEKGEKILTKMTDGFCEYLKKFDERTKRRSTSTNSG